MSEQKTKITNLDDLQRSSPIPVRANWASLRSQGSARIALLLAISTILVAFFQLIFLTKYPPVFIDEPWFANVAWNWVTTGAPGDSMHANMAGLLGSIDWPNIGRVAVFPLKVVFEYLGLGLFQARLVSWIFGVLAVLATLLVGRKAYSTVTGALAALLLVLSAPFTQASHYARPDVILAAAIMLVFWLALFSFERERWWAHLLTGLVLGLAVDIHPNAAMFIPALVSLYIVTYRSRMLRKRGAWLCAVGGFIGIAYYGLSHIASNPEAYFTLSNLSFGGTHKLPLLTALNPVRFARSLTNEIGRYHFFENSLDFVLIGAGVIYLMIRRSLSDVRLLVFTSVAFTCFGLFVGNKHDIYAILFYPFFMLIVAGALVGLWSETTSWRSAQRGFITALVMLLVVSHSIRLARPLMQNRGYDYYEVTESIKAALPSDARVMGLPHWWLGLADYDYRSSLNLTYYHFFNGYDLEEGLTADRPDYLIVDSGLRGLLVDEGYFPPGPGFEIYKLPRQAFETFLDERGTKVEEFDNPWHGKFEVYRLDWSDVQ